MRNFFFSLSLLISSVIISLLLGELLVRVVTPQNLSGSWRVETEKGLLVNKSSGKARHQSGKRVVNYQFHHPHLRGTPVKERGLKILVVGDSYTFGWLVDKEDTYVQLLQKNADEEFGINRFQFLNAAAGGWGAADYVAYVEDFGDAVDPDIILVFLNRGDIIRSLQKNIYTVSDNASSALKRNHRKPSTWKKVWNQIPGYQWLLEHSHLLQLVRRAILTARIGAGGVRREHAPEQAAVMDPGPLAPDASGKRGIDLGTRLFSHLNKWCKDRSIPLLVTTTGWHNYEDAANSRDPMSAFMSVADEVFEKEQIPFMDIFPHMSKELGKDREKYTIKEDGHPNEMGHRLIGNASWESFVKGRLSEYCRITDRCVPRSGD